MKILPEYPNLQFLLREAKAVKSAHRNGDKNICATIGHFDTSLHKLSDQEIVDTRFSILDAQRVVARQYGFSSWSRLKKHVHRCFKGKNPTDITLRNAILARHEKQRSMQKELKSLRSLKSVQKDNKREEEYSTKSQARRQLALDSTSFLSSAFDCHGWPGPDVVGPDCSYALMSVATNAVYDAEFQYRSTRLMEDALPEGSFNAYWFANLKDRILVLSNKPTIYGSFYVIYRDANGKPTLLEDDVVDSENLDRRRATVGHEAIEVTRKWLANEAKEQDWELSTREQCIEEREQLSIEGGYLR